MSMGGGGGGSSQPKDPSKTPPDPSVGVLPRSDVVPGIQRRGAPPGLMLLSDEEYKRKQAERTPSMIG